MSPAEDMDADGMPAVYRSQELARMARDLPVIESITDWCDEFLARPHAELGRGGSVCPFIPRALSSNQVSFVVLRTKNRSEAEIDRIISRFREVFLRTEPVSGPEAIDKAILIILPDVKEEDAAEAVDETHRRLKAEFVESGLMIGKFHPRSEQGGLHNPDFRPLRSPVPLLAIRHMVDSDLPFLNRVDDPVPDRIRFLESYGQRFEDGEETPWSERGRAAVGELRVRTETEK
ncbi:hypothetical protein LHJ74_04250 [Streptomyces sp. N2-109]|uniref:DUF6875 domain-containing protein n=1 Tax=Streptomyces gossypii TaxID=2883101 RepID=A0ABT2JMR1_9ACTN|nr:hypothetical protein [Streptomyces gossypii]MCT2589155.1 hypothetical protein [Streptomyces gossypii]